MKKFLLRTGLLACLALPICFTGQAQDDRQSDGDNHSNNDKDRGDGESSVDEHPQTTQITIRQTGDKPTKLTLEYKKGKYLINGKPVDQYKNGDVSVIINRNDDVDAQGFGPVPPPPPIAAVSPFRDQLVAAMDLQRQSQDMARQSANIARMRMKMAEPRTFLGVACKEAEKNGATVVEVTKGSAAEKAGLIKGDIITRINDQKVDNPKRLTEIVRGYKAGDNIKLVYLRAGKEQTANATLQLSKSGSMAYNYQFQQPEQLQMLQDMHMPRSFLMEDESPKIGLQVQDAEDGKGVTILSVDDSSAAQKAGLKTGDQITAVDGETVKDAEDLADKVGDAHDKISIKATVLRSGTSQDIEIRIPRKLKKADL